MGGLERPRNMEHAACFEESADGIAWASFNEDREAEGLPPVSYEEWCRLTAVPEMTEEEMSALADLEEVVV